MMRDGRWAESIDLVALWRSARSWCLLAIIQILCKLLPRPISGRTSLALIKIASIIRELTITENAMQLILCQERQPADTIFLILS